MAHFNQGRKRRHQGWFATCPRYSRHARVTNFAESGLQFICSEIPAVGVLKTGQTVDTVKVAAAGDPPTDFSFNVHMCYVVLGLLVCNFLFGKKTPFVSVVVMIVAFGWSNGVVWAKCFSQMTPFFSIWVRCVRRFEPLS